MENKDKLKKLLLALSTDDEKQQIEQFDLQINVEQKLDKVDKLTNEKFAQVEDSIKNVLKAITNTRETTAKIATELSEKQDEFAVNLVKALSGNLSEIKSNIPKTVINEFKNLPEYKRFFGPKITVSKEPPADPKVHDLWVEIR